MAVHLLEVVDVLLDRGSALALRLPLAAVGVEVLQVGFQGSRASQACNEDLCSGCGSIGRAAASNTRDPQFKSRHRQNFIYQLFNRKDLCLAEPLANGQRKD